MTETSWPLVTCLCLTRNRLQYLRGAIDCFAAQTYAHRELLIVADATADVEGIVPSGDPRVRCIVLDRRLAIGEKRNIGCEQAQGELIAHWDDDDYSAPRRLEDQVGRLIDSGKALTGYSRMKFADSAGNWWEFYSNDLVVMGTSFLYRRDWWRGHPFKSTGQTGEDTNFRIEAAARGQMIAASAGDLMFASIHPGNTSKRNPLKNTSFRRIQPPQTDWRLAA